jgi:hypothetical protein
MPVTVSLSMGVVRAAQQDVKPLMPRLTIPEDLYYSPGDEAAFFRWLESIPGVARVVGTSDGLVVRLRSRTLSESALRELLALHFRYDLPMQSLAQFETPKNRRWFRARDTYWYARVFTKPKRPNPSSSGRISARAVRTDLRRST